MSVLTLTSNKASRCSFKTSAQVWSSSHRAPLESPVHMLAVLVAVLPCRPPQRLAPSCYQAAVPAAASWRYDYHPKPETPEAEFIDAARNPRNWV